MGSFDLPPERDLPDERLVAMRRHIVDEVRRDRRSSAVPRRLTVPVVAAALLLLSAVGAAAYVLTRPATELLSVGCYDRADVQGNTAIVDADGRDAVEICRELWEDGAITGSPRSAPPLVACVLDTGPAAVFPGEPGTCEQLGLARLDTDRFTRDVVAFDPVREAIVDGVGGECRSEDEARTIIRRELERHGLHDWTVEVRHRHPTNPSPCAIVGFETERRTIYLSFPEDLDMPDDGDVAATGRDGDVAWELLATRSEAGTICLTLRLDPPQGPSPSTSGCGYPAPEAGEVAFVNNPVFGTLDGPEYRTIFGLAGEGIEQVRIELDDGEIAVYPAHRLPAGLGFDASVFVAVPEEPGTDYRTVTGLDADGRPAAAVTAEPSPAASAD